MTSFDQWGMGSSFSGFGLIFMGVAIGLMVLIIFVIVRALQRGNEPSTTQNLALKILQERYARGEIDEAEFNERRRVLGKSGNHRQGTCTIGTGV
ncbi:MAG: hypothetical protein B7X64_07195 [Halothiobacillus sp. 39-53-45]|nr:MAG: hypothetical protein B7X64_07195 [Halothiobacillus sp. 39-53-45]